MFSHRPFTSLGHAHHGWLNARHHFSFANYHNPQRMGWGALRVWNDDEIAPRSGFPTHPHQNMEIITYVTRGAITHKDSLGNEGKTHAGDIQVMSAGSGVAHSEYNLEDETTSLFQIWIIPDEQGGQPSWGHKPFPKTDRTNQWVALASGMQGDDDALPIRANARVVGATLQQGQALMYEIPEGRLAYLVPAMGRVDVNGTHLNARDGLACAPGQVLSILAQEDSELVLVDVLP